MPSEPANFYTSTRAAGKVIVVDLGFLGDAVHLVPALWELKQHYPQAALHVVTSPVGGEVLRLAPCVDRVWTVELDRARRTLGQQWEVLRAVRRERFDAAFNFSGADRTVFWTALTGARHRVAHAAGRRHFWQPWLVPVWVPRQPAGLPVFEQRRRMLAACGFALSPPRFDLRVPKAAAERAAALAAEGAVHCSINASSPLKEWPLEHWIELALQLLAADPALRIVATGSRQPRERTRLTQFLSGVSSPRLLVPPADLSLAELAALLQSCRLHVGADSGVLHLAMALGRPTVSLFRDYADARAWLPAGPAHETVSVPCACVNQPVQPCEPFARADCLARLAPAHVAGLVLRRLAAKDSPDARPL